MPADRQRAQTHATNREGEPIECKNQNARAYKSECLVCHRKIIIHCEDCGVQSSGCLCTLTQRTRRTKDA